MAWRGQGWSRMLWLKVLLCLAGAWRRARPEQIERIHHRVAAAVDHLVQDPLDVQVYSRMETACKDEGDHNSRLRILQTIVRIEPSVRDQIQVSIGYALGDRAFWHAKACRFEERERDFLLWKGMWERGAWEAQGQLPVLPFYALVFDFNMQQVLEVSRVWGAMFGSYIHREEPPRPLQPFYSPQFLETGVIKVGYVSSDIYRVHPVGKSINAMLRSHDQTRFEVHAFLLVGSQIEEAVELEEGTGGVMLTDLSIMSSGEGAVAINEEGIHVLIDLNGHTSGVRMELFAYGPAPITMHYMGFGATIGAAYMQYFLADTAVATPELSVYYTEKLVYLPATFYVNSYAADSHKLPAVQRNASYRDERMLQGLPPDGTVLCNFNHLHKTSRRMWAHWSQILLGSEDAVLWTLNDNPVTQANIAAELHRNGVEGDKVKYAGHELIWQHLHRHALADLFLDNNEYNGGTTGLDAYWAGVPILSYPMEKFSARYGASFNRGAGLEQLTARDWADYVDVALRLTSQPEVLAAMRDHLQEDKPNKPMFHTPSFMRRYEEVLKMQWELKWAMDEEYKPMHIVRRNAGSRQQ